MPECENGCFEARLRGRDQDRRNRLSHIDLARELAHNPEQRKNAPRRLYQGTPRADDSRLTNRL